MAIRNGHLHHWFFLRLREKRQLRNAQDWLVMQWASDGCCR